jgi:uncharacterized protein with ParB-like and HNH nuclease domain
MKEIQGKTRKVRELLNGAKYGIDYYQREYKWQFKQISELVDDLTERFLEYYNPAHSREEVVRYGQYFLGSIIISQRDNEQLLLVDGQQRLTSLTLLLIFLHNIQRDREDVRPIEDLIFSEQYSKKSFNLDVPNRNDCMKSLLDGKTFDTTSSIESVVNLVGRYEDIFEYFPESLRDKALPYFIDWLLEKVSLVEITADPEDAYRIFETMNDRGLSLSATEMLKGYLLDRIHDIHQRDEADKCIKKWLSKFSEFSKETEASFFKTWLRSQYAEKMREVKKDAVSEDFELIGNSYHRWIRDSEDLIGLKEKDSNSYFQWVIKDFNYYARIYSQILTASKNITPGLQSICYNADNGFTLQYQLLLAPLKPTDDETTTQAKLKLVADFIDCWLNRRIWNSKSILYATVSYTVFQLTKQMRGLSVADLRSLLIKRLQDENESINFTYHPSLNRSNGKNLHCQLARLIDWVEIQSGEPGRYSEYVVRSRKCAYEIEHIWANRYDLHARDFDDLVAFRECRNRMGGLLLLPKKINASLSDKEYDYKIEHYLKENLLAKSLHKKCYENNPGFAQAIKQNNLAFKAYYKGKKEAKSVFTKVDLEERFQLYQKIAEQLWSISRLEDKDV